MPYKLHRSAIITGTVNCFCLACDRFLEDREEALRHIKTSSHCESLSAVSYLERFKDQYIRKFNAGYYCEFCNTLMASAVQVNLHVAEDHHKQMKGTNLLKFMDGGVIAFNNIVIRERAWHGLMDNICYICDIEFENEDLHKSDTSHALGLIQRAVKFGTNDVVYRQIYSKLAGTRDFVRVEFELKIFVKFAEFMKNKYINNSTVQCLTCNILLDSRSMSKHFDDAEHINVYNNCKIGKNKEFKEEKDINEDLANPTNLSNNTDTTDDKKQNSSCIKEGDTLMIQRAGTFQCNDIDINYEREVAFCRKCRVYIKFECNDIVKHIEEHSNIERSTSPIAQYPSNVNKSKYCTKPQQNEVDVDDINNSANKGINNERNSTEIRDFAKDNDIAYNLNGGKAFCQTCKVELPFSLKTMKEHVKGIPHNRNLKTNRAKMNNSRRKQPVKKYINSMSIVELPWFEGCIINETVLISFPSFYLSFQHKNSDNVVECLMCGYDNSEFCEYTIDAHFETCSLPFVTKAQVILTDKSEFIREIKPETFHCGHCNVIVSGWSEMESHLQGREHHRRKKRSMVGLGVVRGVLPLQALLLLDDV